MLRVFAVYCVVLVGFFEASAQTLIDAFDVSNRTPSVVPILIDSFAIIKQDTGQSFNPRQFRVLRCDTDQEVPFYLEPWQPGTDSVMCWVRITDAPASKSVVILVETDPRITTSKSNGRDVFLTFQDSIRPTSNQGAGGPWAPWIGPSPAYGRGLFIDAVITALEPKGGYFCYYGADEAGSAGYVLEHDARLGRQDPDHLRISPGSVVPVPNAPEPEYFQWDVNEPVRYNITLEGTNHTIFRTSLRDPRRQHRIRTVRDSLMPWVMHGVASFPGASQSIAVQYVRSRPRYLYAPRTSRRGVTINATPTEAVICNGEPVTLTAPTIGWRRFRWSTGDTTASITVRTAGTYFVELSDGQSCTVKTPSIVVTSDNAPSAGNDTTITLCLGRRETLRVKSGFAKYEWYMSSGTAFTKMPSTGPELLIDSADVYRCFVRSVGGCLDTVRFVVNRIYDTTAKIVFPFANPSICEGDSLVLRVDPPQSAEYTWSRDGVQLPERSDRLTVRTSGVYTVAVRIGNSSDGCLSVSSITVQSARKDSFLFPERVEFCEGDSITLDAGLFPQVEWYSLRGGQRRLITQFSRVIRLKSSDTIECVGSNSGVCRDTARCIVTMNAAPRPVMATLENKSSMCVGEIFTLRSNTAAQKYTWRLWDNVIQSAQDSSQIQITVPGVYYLAVEYANGCRRYDSLRIDDGLAPPDIVALDGQALCPGDSTRLTTIGKFDRYLWSTGDTTAMIWAKQPGVYGLKVKLFECESDTTILIEEADPSGPSLAYRDSATVCPASPTFWMTIRNNQGVPRKYNIEVLDSTIFTVRAPVVSIQPRDTASVAFNLVSMASNQRFVTWRVLLSDDCLWSRELAITIENREKIVPLEIVVASPRPEIRAGDVISMNIRGDDASGLRDFRNGDTLWIETSVPADLFEINNAAATCDNRTIAIDEPRGRVKYCMTGCENGTTDPLIQQTLSVLVSETLQAFMAVDSIRTSGPCITAPIVQKRVDVGLAPFGCELTTILRSPTLIIGIGTVSENSVTANVSQSSGAVTVRAVDVLGRILDQHVISAGTGLRATTLTVGYDKLFYIVASDDTSVVTIPVAGAGR
ncbi:MAG: DUF2341 domain-containing protein [Candidatus Kapabacteria bacterium]|nr:DUF2341 domain-containing protein [Candidatus Kapabacteria bacterium]